MTNFDSDSCAYLSGFNSNQLWETLFDNSPTGMAIIDLNTDEVIFANRKFFKYTGISPVVLKEEPKLRLAGKISEISRELKFIKSDDELLSINSTRLSPTFCYLPSGKSSLGAIYLEPAIVIPRPIVHDLNNILTAINGYCLLLNSKFGNTAEGQSISRYLKEISQLNDRAIGMFNLLTSGEETAGDHTASNS